MPSRDRPLPRHRGRRIAYGFTAAALFALLWVATSRDLRRDLEAGAAEVIGTGVTQLAAAGSDDTHSRDFVSIPVEVRKIAENVYQARGLANTQVVATADGHVVFDTGLATQAAKQRRVLKAALPDGPITHVILSHSHQDHAGGARFWIEDGTEVVAHQQYPEEQRYLKELEDYFWARNRMLFPFMPESPPKSGMFAYGGIVPTTLVHPPEALRFEQGGVRFELLPTPGAEGADNLTLWLPDQKIFFAGDFFGPNFPQFPNIFTMRGEKVRKPVEYIESLDRVIALEPGMIVPSHQDPIIGRERILADLVRMRDAVKFVHDSVVAGMNAGKTVHQLMEEVVLPPSLDVTQIHGRVSWAVKSIWEYYATWFHFDSTTELYHVPQSSVAPEIAQLAGVGPLTEHALTHIEAGRNLQALHLLDIASAGAPDDRAVLEARRRALSNLLEEARATFNNTYEIDWLEYRIRAIDAGLAAGG